MTKTFVHISKLRPKGRLGLYFFTLLKYNAVITKNHWLRKDR